MRALVFIVLSAYDGFSCDGMKVKNKGQFFSVMSHKSVSTSLCFSHLEIQWLCPGSFLNYLLQSMERCTHFQAGDSSALQEVFPAGSLDETSSSVLSSLSLLTCSLFYYLFIFFGGKEAPE